MFPVLYSPNETEYFLGFFTSWIRICICPTLIYSVYCRVPVAIVRFPKTFELNNPFDFCKGSGDQRMCATGYEETDLNYGATDEMENEEEEEQEAADDEDEATEGVFAYL